MGEYVALNSAGCKVKGVVDTWPEPAIERRGNNETQMRLVVARRTAKLKETGIRGYPGNSELPVGMYL